MKRRPWWSDFRHLTTLLLGGLLGIASLTAGAESGEPVAKAGMAATKGGVPAARKRLRKPPASNIGQAEILESDLTGLHGQASFYGQGFQGRKTATGDPFDVRLFTAASNRFPLGTVVAVRRLDNDRCAIVKINDRMHARHRRRIIDVSRGVAEYLDMVRAGVVMVRVARLPKAESRRNGNACLAAFEPTPACTTCLPEADGQPAIMTDFLGVER